MSNLVGVVSLPPCYPMLSSGMSFAWGMPNNDDGSASRDFPFYMIGAGDLISLLPAIKMLEPTGMHFRGSGQARSRAITSSQDATE